MLFISRAIGFNDWGVIDTDDWSEQRVSQKELVDYINIPGIVIEGVDVHYNIELGIFSTDNVVPYQPAETVTMLQSKTNLLRHVDITVCKSSITRIHIRHKEFTGAVSLRLSDFGTECADLVLKGNMPSAHRHTVTLILDDKIHLNDLSFFLLPYQDKLVSVGTKGVGVVFDVREVTREETVRNVYRALLNGDSREFRDSILDDGARKERMLQAVRRWRKAAK